MGASAVLLWPYKPDNVKVVGIRRIEQHRQSVVARGRLLRIHPDGGGVASWPSYAAVSKHADGYMATLCFLPAGVSCRSTLPSFFVLNGVQQRVLRVLGPFCCHMFRLRKTGLSTLVHHELLHLKSSTFQLPSNPLPPTPLFFQGYAGEVPQHPRSVTSALGLKSNPKENKLKGRSQKR